MNLYHSKEEIIENIEKIIKERRFGECCVICGYDESYTLEFNLAIGKKYKVEIRYYSIKKDDEKCPGRGKCETLDVTELLINEYKPVLEIKDSVFFYDNIMYNYNNILQENYIKNIKNTKRKKENVCCLS